MKRLYLFIYVILNLFLWLTRIRFEIYWLWKETRIFQRKTISFTHYQIPAGFFISRGFSIRRDLSRGIFPFTEIFPFLVKNLSNIREPMMTSVNNIIPPSVWREKWHIHFKKHYFLILTLVCYIWKSSPFETTDFKKT